MRLSHAWGLFIAGSSQQLSLLSFAFPLPLFLRRRPGRGILGFPEVQMVRQKVQQQRENLADVLRQCADGLLGRGEHEEAQIPSPDPPSKTLLTSIPSLFRPLISRLLLLLLVSRPPLQTVHQCEVSDDSDKDGASANKPVALTNVPAARLRLRLRLGLMLVLAFANLTLMLATATTVTLIAAAAEMPTAIAAAAGAAAAAEEALQLAQEAVAFYRPARKQFRLGSSLHTIAEALRAWGLVFLGSSRCLLWAEHVFLIFLAPCAGREGGGSFALASEPGRLPCRLCRLQGRT